MMESRSNFDRFPFFAILKVWSVNQQKRNRTKRSTFHWFINVKILSSIYIFGSYAFPLATHLFLNTWNFWKMTVLLRVDHIFFWKMIHLRGSPYLSLPLTFSYINWNKWKQISNENACQISKWSSTRQPGKIMMCVFVWNYAMNNLFVCRHTFAPLFIQIEHNNRMYVCMYE